MKCFKKRVPGILIVSFLLLAGWACSSTNSKKGAEGQDPPNVILVLVDDMGIGDLSLYGQQTLSTPNIEQMANEGIHFTNMYTGSTVCAPSRAALLTGKHTGHTSVRGNSPQQLIADDEMTIARVFKNAGYTTGAIGKWGIGSYMPTDEERLKGGYEPSVAIMAPGSPDILIQSAHKLLNRIYGE